ncbi:unnamed protein product [Trichogramma brassicae]|uniref:CCHC-type domain-containing protein n=1 Tax=Trichogramma brassicae TaxID=86971 RepID=A0A6H5I1Y4_9HYME|nr:unnamed protein product [Trichogramma brassicae]
MPASADVSTELARTSVLHRRVRGRRPNGGGEPVLEEETRAMLEQLVAARQPVEECDGEAFEEVFPRFTGRGISVVRGGRGDGYASSRRRSDGGKRTGATATFGIRTRTSCAAGASSRSTGELCGRTAMAWFFQPFVEQQQRRSQAGSPSKGNNNANFAVRPGYQEEQQQQHRQLPRPRLQPQQHQQEEAYVEVRPLSPVAGPSSLSGNAAAPARIRGENFGGLQLVRFVLGLGPPRGAFFECHQPGHTRRQCRNPFDGVLCTNCGRRGVKVQQCPRCSRGWKKSQRNFHSKKAAAKKQLWKALGGERR